MANNDGTWTPEKLMGLWLRERNPETMDDIELSRRVATVLESESRALGGTLRTRRRELYKRVAASSTCKGEQTGRAVNSDRDVRYGYVRECQLCDAPGMHAVPFTEEGVECVTYLCDEHARRLDNDEPMFEGGS